MKEATFDANVRNKICSFISDPKELGNMRLVSKYWDKTVEIYMLTEMKREIGIAGIYDCFSKMTNQCKKCNQRNKIRKYQCTKCNHPLIERGNDPSYCVAIGNNSQSYANNSIAIGHNPISYRTNCVSYGTYSNSLKRI